MTSAILFLTVGSVLLVVLLLFLHSSSASGKINDRSEAQEILDALQAELLPDWFVDRLFSREDREFARTENSPEILRLFETERKAVALAWLKQTQDYVAQLMDFHVRLARQRPDLKPSVELKLTLEYLRFRLVCGLLAGVLRAMGPCRVRGFAAYAVNQATHLGAVSEKVLSSLDDAVSVAE